MKLRLRTRIWLPIIMEADAYVVILHFMIPGGGLIGPIQSHLGLSDIQSDPGSQLSYEQFSPYYLAPILLAFPIPLVQVGLRPEAHLIPSLLSS